MNSSDYMIHARSRGETFGLAIAEFSIRNKPVISYSDSPEKAHLDILDDKCFKYSSRDELFNLLINLDKNSLSKSTVQKLIDAFRVFAFYEKRGNFYALFSVFIMSLFFLKKNYFKVKF